MKKLILLIAIVVFASCSSDDDSGTVNTNEFENIKTTLPQGTWEITTFIDGQEDKTLVFESFVFTFKEDGTVEGETDLFTETGTWAYDNTSSTSEEELVLQFSGTEPFSEISDDWDIVSVSNSKVELSDDTDDDPNGDTELLTFTKI
ncbi:glycoside hydrolase family 43 C-terminal domain-containing protein [Aequorivita marina]|uniref:glycoside hydrolase family 43 C-terminal domain-containing protein n=1 Tax=Aequorivita marina TaxID=3073654 RepID=UPI002876BFA9|nr:glycoside hydrolase family 43 C-terminal domain-containing protein [Aequorivita sp. S2608]MDS1297867.1 glycoside hydrolase family 43 C-terminal domain-containing protein [Aequorivita sp. S2608]